MISAQPSLIPPTKTETECWAKVGPDSSVFQKIIVNYVFKSEIKLFLLFIETYKVVGHLALKR